MTVELFSEDNRYYTEDGNIERLEIESERNKLYWIKNEPCVSS